MATGRWYSKASVQAAIVNIIPAFLVAIAGIAIQAYYASKQLEQNSKIAESQTKAAERQSTKDSLLNVRESNLTNRQIELSELEFRLAKKGYLNDSLLGQKQFQIANSQLELTVKDKSIQYSADKIKLGNTLSKINDQYLLLSTELNAYSEQDKAKWAKELLAVFESETTNPALLNDAEALLYWQKAIRYLKTDIELYSDPSFIYGQVTKDGVVMQKDSGIADMRRTAGVYFNNYITKIDLIVLFVNYKVVKGQPKVADQIRPQLPGKEWWH